MFVVVFIIGLNKICAKHSTLKGFYRGLGVVKGKGVASAKKRSPFHLKKRKGNLNFITLVAKWGFHRNHPFGVAFAGFAPLRN